MTMSRAKRYSTLQEIIATEHFLASFLISVIRVVPKLEGYSTPVAFLTCQAMAVCISLLRSQQLKTRTTTEKWENQPHSQLSSKHPNSGQDALKPFRCSTKNNPMKCALLSHRLQHQAASISPASQILGILPWSQKWCWLQHITALPRKARKKPPCTHGVEIKHRSQAESNQHISQHMQESAWKYTTTISRNLGEMFCN